FGQVRARISQSFVLANQTAQLLGQVFHALLDLRIFVGLRIFRDDDYREANRDTDESDELFRCANCFASGRILWFRSEERRVGKECRARWSTATYKQINKTATSP